MMRTVRRGGILIVSDVNGNLTIHARGDGEARVQQADVPDLMLALREIKDAHVLDDLTPTDNFKMIEADTLVGDERDPRNQRNSRDTKK